MSGLIHVIDEQYGVLRKSARLNPTSIPIKLLTPHLINYIITNQTPIHYKVIYDTIEPRTLFPSFSNLIANDSIAQNDINQALQEMYSSDYSDSEYSDGDSDSDGACDTDDDIDGDIIMTSSQNEMSSDSDYDWNDAIESLPSNDSDYEHTTFEFNKNIIKQTLHRLLQQHRIDSMTYGTYIADIEWSISIEDLNLIAQSITTNYY